MTKQLTAASKLIEGLTGERVRWGEDVVLLEQKAVKLIGDCLIGASFLSYLGAFTTDYRRILIHDKFVKDISERGIPISLPFSLESLLCTDTMIQNWTSQGLPADEHSIQNGILTTKGSRFPLCIDPQQQAVNWIKKTYANKNLTVKSLTDSDFMKHLELAIQVYIYADVQYLFVCVAMCIVIHMHILVQIYTLLTYCYSRLYILIIYILIYTYTVVRQPFSV